jgi:hypothetical protein
MEGKFKHNKNGKFESRYSEEFKRKVIEEYLETGTPPPPQALVLHRR